MRRITSVSVSVLVVLLLSIGSATALASGPGTDPGPEVLPTDACAGTGTDEQIEALAEFILKGQVAQEVRACYESLNVEGKARVFEAMAEQQGMLGVLRDETRQDKALMEQDLFQLSPNGLFYETLVRHGYPMYTPVYGASSWYSNSTCDGDPSDIDYTFVFQFPSAVTNPDGLRTFSFDLRVDAMLSYYQIVHGGVRAWGNTSSPYVHTCMGNDGVGAAGGPDNVYRHMKMFRLP